MGSGSSNKDGGKTSAQAADNKTEASGQTAEQADPAATAAANTTEAAPAPAYTIADEVIVENEYCAFKIVKAEVDRIWGFQLKVYCENKTADKNLMFSVDDVSVNGYMTDPLWAEQVAPGKKSNDEITFSSTALNKIGLTTVDEIEFTLRIHNYDDWKEDDIVNDVFTVYPTGLSADAVTIPERRTTATEQVVLDNDSVLFVILDTAEDSIWGYTLNCYLENRTDKTLMFSWSDVSVNGFMVDPFWAEEVAPGKRCYDGISFSKSGFEQNGITKVEEIEYTLRIYDSSDWKADDVYKETLKYKP